MIIYWSTILRKPNVVCIHLSLFIMKQRIFFVEWTDPQTYLQCLDYLRPYGKVDRSCGARWLLFWNTRPSTFGLGDDGSAVTDLFPGS